MTSMEDAIFDDVVDILQELLSTIESIFDKYRDPQSKGDDILPQLMDECGDVLVSKLHTTRALVSTILEKKSHLPVPAASLRTLVTRKLGEIMENAHRVRATLRSSETLGSPSGTPNLRSGLPPMRQEPSASSAAELRTSELHSARQIFRAAIENLDNAQRIFRIAYHTVGDVSSPILAPLERRLNASLPADAHDTIAQEVQPQRPFQGFSSAASKPTRGGPLEPDPHPVPRLNSLGREGMDASAGGTLRPASIGLPPKSPNASSPPPLSVSSLKEVATPAESANFLPLAERAPTQHVHHLPGKAWGDLIELDQPRVVETLVKDVMDLFNYGATELLVLPSDVSNVSLSCGDGLLHMSFELANLPDLSHMDVDLRIGLCAFPNMRVLYSEYASALQAKRRSLSPPQEALSHEWCTAHQDLESSPTVIPPLEDCFLRGGDTKSEQSSTGSDTASLVLRRSTTARPDWGASEEPSHSFSVEEKNSSDMRSALPGHLNTSFTQSGYTPDQTGKMKAPHSEATLEMKKGGTFLSSPIDASEFRSPSDGKLGNTNLELAPDHKPLKFVRENAMLTLCNDSPPSSGPASIIIEPLSTSMDAITLSSHNSMKVLFVNNHNVNSLPTKSVKLWEHGAGLSSGSSSKLLVRDPEFSRPLCNDTVKEKSRVNQGGKEVELEKNTMLCGIVDMKDSRISSNGVDNKHTDQLVSAKVQELSLAQEQHKPLLTAFATEPAATHHEAGPFVVTGELNDSESESCELSTVLSTSPRDWQPLPQPPMPSAPPFPYPRPAPTSARRPRRVATPQPALGPTSLASAPRRAQRARHGPTPSTRPPLPSDALHHPKRVATAAAAAATPPTPPAAVVAAALPNAPRPAAAPQGGVVGRPRDEPRALRRAAALSPLSPPLLPLSGPPLASPWVPASPSQRGSSSSIAPLPGPLPRRAVVVAASGEEEGGGAALAKAGVPRREEGAFLGKRVTRRGEGPDQREGSSGEKGGPGGGRELGLVVDAQRLVVRRAGGLAAAAGLRPGDRLRTVDGRPILSARQLRDHLAAPSRGHVFLTVQTAAGDIAMRRLVLPACVEDRRVDEEGLAKEDASELFAVGFDGGKAGAHAGRNSQRGHIASTRSSSGRESGVSNANRRLFGTSSPRGVAVSSSTLSDRSRQSLWFGPNADAEPPLAAPPHRQVEKGTSPPNLWRKVKKPLLSSPAKGHNARSGGRHPHKVHVSLRTLTDTKSSPLAPRFTRVPSTMMLGAKLYTRAHSALAMQNGLLPSPDIFSGIRHSATPEVMKRRQEERVVGGRAAP